MSKRLQLALSKFVFCYKASADVSTFIRLLGNTKRLSLSFQKRCLQNEKPSFYKLNLNKREQLVLLRTYAGDIAIFYEIFWQKAYEKFPINFSEFKTIIDIGANIGLASLFFHSVAPNAKILAIEPEQHNFELLQNNISNTACAEQIKAINAAISNQDGELYLKTERFAYNTAVSHKQQEKVVRSISLNTCIQEYKLAKVDLIKIDVEGFEHQIFSSNLGWLDKVDNIIIEIHSTKDYITCIDTLVQKGFAIQSVKPKTPDQENIYWAFKK